MNFKEFRKKYDFVSDDHNNHSDKERVDLCIHAHYNEAIEIIRLVSFLKKDHAKRIQELNKQIKNKSKRQGGH